MNRLFFILLFLICSFTAIGQDVTNFEKVKNWYATIKSRPSFRDILEESIYNIAPSLHYKDLDF